MDRDNLGYALARYGMDVLYLCEETIIQMCRLLEIMVKRKRGQWRRTIRIYRGLDAIGSEALFFNQLSRLIIDYDARNRL